jgi:hypothetical protein
VWELKTRKNSHEQQGKKKNECEEVKKKKGWVAGGVVSNSCPITEPCRIRLLLQLYSSVGHSKFLL